MFVTDKENKFQTFDITSNLTDVKLVHSALSRLSEISNGNKSYRSTGHWNRVVL